MAIDWTPVLKEHCLRACQLHDEGEDPPSRPAQNTFLLLNNKKYPAKHIRGLAYRLATGRRLNPNADYSGGWETVRFFNRLGFDVEYDGKLFRGEHLQKVETFCQDDRQRIPDQIISGKGQKDPQKDSLKRLGFGTGEKDQQSGVIPDGKVADAEHTNHETQRVEKHNEGCPRCKATVKAMLERIYDEVYTAYSFAFGATLEEYANSPLYPVLKEIYSSLQALRGNREFIRARSLPPVDYYVPKPGFVVEFDESQHFTACRKLALSRYPDDLSVKFNVERWIRLCSEINAEDRSPIYRDEQRAWYDTLRDFAPIIHGLKPTVRLYSNDIQWCSLNPDNADDRAVFERALMDGLPKWEMKPPIFDSEPWVARIVIDGVWSKKPEDAVKLLSEICDIWGGDDEIRNFRTQFLMTCGGFLEFEWPSSVTRNFVGDCWNPSSGALKALFSAAEQALRRVLTHELLGRLAKLTDYLTIGVDSSKKVELVSLVNTQTGYSIWTGKTYPTNAEQSGLIRVQDLKTHFINLPDIGTVMVLGCHDLNIFNNRNLEHTGLIRKTLKNDFRQLAKAKKPVVILHHPHTTPSSRTWASAWGWVRANLPSVKWYASAGRYDSEKELPLLDNTNVLTDTKQGGSIDFVVYAYRS